MSLRLLQKATNDAPKGKGKTRGKRSSMSLQQFHQQTQGVASNRPSGSAWGKGAAMRTCTWAAEEPTPADADLAAGSPTRSQSFASAWVKGPPASAMDTLWDAPPTVEEVPEEVWQAPAVLPHDTPAEEAAKGDGFEGAEAFEVAEEATRPCAEDSKVEDPFYRDICAWLKHLNLSEHQEAIYTWCEEMGAATLEEVVESAEDLLEAVHIKPLQVKRLQSKAQEALDAVRMELQEVQEVKLEPEEAKSSEVLEVLEPSDAGQEEAPEGKSYYAPATSSGAARAQSYYKSLAKIEDENYLKSSFTETATWLPMAKAASQGSRKRRHKEQLKEAEQAKLAEDLAEEEKRLEAQRLMEQQLREEKERKLTEARALIASTLERSESEAFYAAVAAAKEVDLPAEEIREAERQLKLALQRRLQARNDALCTLQATLEAPKDESFGPAVRKALEEARAAGAIQHLSAGAEAEAASKKALQEWELAEQHREDSMMALQFALRQREIGALEAALSEAKKAGLADDSGLVAEASSLLQELVEKERLETEAQQKLQQALDEEDLAGLEIAVSLCKTLRLPLQPDVDETLKQWRKEAAERQAVEEELEAALSSEDPVAVREVLARARTKLRSEVLLHAEAKASELEFRAKRREMARLELCLAINARVIQRLQSALEAAQQVSLPAEHLQEAETILQELQDQERRRNAVLERLQEAMQQRDLAPLKEVLQEAHAELSLEEPEMLAAQQLLEELEEEAKKKVETALRRRSAEAIYAAVEEGDWDKIQVALDVGLAAGLAEEGAPVRAAQAKLESLREAHEQQEAQWTVEETEARLEALKAAEGKLQGPRHKKERSALGKEIMKLRNGESYISARNFPKNPEKERQRREEQRAEIEKRHAEETERRRVRAEQAPQELATAMEAGDDDAIRALLVEALLCAADAQLAESFLAECEEKGRRAERDGALLEFVFADLDRRAFFQASVTLAAFFADQYSMHEGSDFKLKVVKGAHSVLVAFRSSDYAEAVKQTASALAKLCATGSMSSVAAAAIKGAGDISPEAEELLVGVRQDAEVLKARPARPECDQALKDAAARARGEAPAIPVKTQSALPRAATASAAEERRSTTVAGGKGGLYTGKGQGKAAAAPGKGDKNGTRVDPDVFKLPKSSAELQRDPEKAKTFQEDLRTFARNFKLSAELVGMDYIQLKPIGFVPHDTKQKAREELRMLLEFHFPSTSRPIPTRQTHLRVHPEHGAGIELTVSEQGYLVDFVEDFPGQDLSVGDVILEINGQKLAGLSEAEMEDKFGAHFGDGAKLTIQPER